MLSFTHRSSVRICTEFVKACAFILKKANTFLHVKFCCNKHNLNLGALCDLSLLGPSATRLKGLIRLECRAVLSSCTRNEHPKQSLHYLIKHADMT